jgi:hypothetical protein
VLVWYFAKLSLVSVIYGSFRRPGDRRVRTRHRGAG